MKWIFALVFLFFTCVIYGQDFRLSYDPSTIPELYNSTTVFLEEKTSNGYRRIKGKYKLFTQDGELRGNQLRYTSAHLVATNGEFQFTVKLNGVERQISLQMPTLEHLRFNLYADSIKPILNYYVNVEAKFSSGRVYPLNEEQVEIICDHGLMKGNEWIAPKDINFEGVHFTAVYKFDRSIKKSVTVFLKKIKDPRDYDGYEERRRVPGRFR